MSIYNIEAYMEKNFLTIIDQIKQANETLKEQYQKAQLIDGTNLSGNTTIETKNGSSYDYQKLMRQHKALLYKKDHAAKEKAELNAKNPIQMDEQVKQQIISRINYKQAHEEMHDKSNDLCKTWNKLPNNLKIQAVLKFIETIKPKITTDQSNQLRYLLISSISQRKLNTLADVGYNHNLGYIEIIHKLCFDDGVFKLMDTIDPVKSISLTSFDTKVTTPIKPKLSISSGTNDQSEVKPKKLITLIMKKK